MKTINRSKIRTLILLLVFCFVVVLASCGSSTGATNQYAKETATSSGCSSSYSKTQIEWVQSKISEGDASLENPTDEDLAANHKKNLVDLITNYAIESGIANSEDEDTISENYKVINIRNDKTAFLAYVQALDANSIVYESDAADLLQGSSTSSCAGMFNVTEKQIVSTTISNIINNDTENGEKDGYRIAIAYMIKVTQRCSELEPLVLHKASFGDFMGHLWGNFIFFLGWLIYLVSKLCGGYYWIGLTIVTLAIRTLGWPIYSKTNDMSSKMTEMQPELTKIQEKYANRQDKDSQRMMQMEQAQLYKKYKVGIGGCLAPIIQFPIFIAIYRAVSRFMYTVDLGTEKYCNNWANELNPKLFGLNLFNDMSVGGTSQIIGIIILLILVVGTQILSQVLTKLRQKKNNERRQADIPAYRRQAVQQSQNQSQMNMMMYMMIAMMGMFVWTSKAGLGLYWFIGNAFTIGQMAINNYISEKKKAAAKKKSGIIDAK